MHPVTSRDRPARDITLTLDHAPVRVVPLPCPVLEQDRIPDRRCDMVHSTGGVTGLGWDGALAALRRHVRDQG